MATENDFYTILIDDYRFTLLKSTLINNNSFLISRMIMTNEKNDFIKINGNTIYIDKDPLSFKYVLDKIRGYEIEIDNINDNNLKKKVINDLNFFGLNNENKKDWNQDSILNNMSDEYDEKDVFSFNKLTNMLNLNKKTEDTLRTTEAELDTSVLRSNNNEDINNLILKIDNKLKDKLKGGNPFEVMNTFSNDETIQNILKSINQKNNSESDVESLNLDNDLEEESELITDVSYNPNNTRIKTNYISIS